ncbi:sensor histidine kinase [Streptosporangium jomthongense]|uniref:Sensor histidine kinase n=1 Tax=Streptosporangium jomthongense TaxID=1193683 RepID=A0ABV8F8N2_9ACTN
MTPEERPRPGGDPAGPNTWESSPAVWEILLVPAILLPVVLVVTGGMTVPGKAVAAGCLLAVLPLYLLLGRPAMTADDLRRGTVYIAVLVVLYCVAVSVAPISTLALFGLCPQCFVIHPARTAMIPVAVLSVAHIPRHLFLDGPVGYELLTVTVVVILFSAVFGVWSERVTERSAERAALIRELVDSRTEVARLSAERGAMAERERLAGEIHDTLAQGFTSIIMLVQAAQAQPDPARHLRLAVRTARENLAEARALIAALGPAPLDGSTLEEALERLTERLGEEAGLATAFTVHGRSRPLPPAVEVVLLRVAQEALANVRRHSGAGRADVGMVYGPETVTLEVRDDGAGFEPPVTEGYGLRGMRARVEQVGGRLLVRGARGTGTTLTAEVPG